MVKSMHQVIARHRTKLGAASVSRFDTAWTYQVASRVNVYHISSMCDHARDRGVKQDHPQLQFWEQEWEAQGERAKEFNSAIDAFLKLDNVGRNDIKDNSMTTQEWKDRFNTALEKMEIWVEKMKELLANEEVKKFVAEEEVLVAAEPKEDS